MGREVARKNSGIGNGSLSMAEKDLQQIVEHAVAQVLERQLPKLQAELVERVLAELPATLPAAAPTGAGSPVSNTNLVQAVATIHGGSTQKEILAPCSKWETPTARALRSLW